MASDKVVIKRGFSGEVLVEVLTMRDADLMRKELQGANFHGLNLYYTRFQGSDLRGACFDRTTNHHPNAVVQLAGAALWLLGKIEGYGRPPPLGHPATYLDSAKLSGASFANADLYGPSFTRSDLTASTFTQAKIERGQFNTTNLSEAKFEDARLICCNFEQADMQRAYLVRAVFERCKFRGANLENADLTQASLATVDFSGANLKGATVAGATWKDVKFDGATRWPEGFSPPK